MAEFYYHKNEQQTKFSNQSTPELSSVHTKKNKNSPPMKKNLTDDDNNNEMHKTTSTTQAVPYRGSKTSDQQQATYNQVSRTLVDQLSLTESSNMNIIVNQSNQTLSSCTDKNSNKDELSTINDEPKNSITKLIKRNKPITKPNLRRQANIKDNSILNEPSNAQISVNHYKTKSDKAKIPIKRTEKTIPIFIPPKKSSTSLYPFSASPLDDSLQNRQKSCFKQPNKFAENNNSLSNTNWTEALSTNLLRTRMQSLGSSYDENSTDESDDESLFIRHSKSKIIDQQVNSFMLLNINIPSAIFITDPYGHSYKFNPDTDTQEIYDCEEQSFDNDSKLTVISSLSSNNSYDTCSPSEIVSNTSIALPSLEKHRLHSIGEEEEDGDQNSSKEFNRNEVSNRARETTSNKEKNKDDSDATKVDTDKDLLGRRWSDGNTDDEKLQITTSIVKASCSTSIAKAPSATSITKQTVNSPVKLSLKKYLLMKLHLASSSKDDESNMPSQTINPPKRRLVRRAADKTRYQTH
ncbi:unnamed protein product [Rotaria socialis]|uniref:Uncharacterized protein n=3 Tax=Rotaria socialis TaxID=392032 RepID=A0A818AEC0_9BILA|nr:unnamed protein product [Rotaria socialis]CAF3596231.1 unnamed protein product [Rotaria socialis]CAF4382566.1 unnamed protein product [Rotaria socialis]CAF4502121.1 unnamed protein product [Rotaria socialis]